MEIPFELSSLRDANRYSNWIYKSVESFLGNRILELGAGIGNLTQWLPVRDLLVVTETEDSLMQTLKERLKLESSKVIYKKIDLNQSFFEQVKIYEIDTIVSFNVMEHIEDDIQALREQVRVLKESQAKGPKRLVIFAPAHQFAFGSYDEVFKHFRRYSGSELKKKLYGIDPSLQVKTYYFNLLSLAGWIIQGRLLKSTTFNPSQIKLLEKVIPYFAPVDFILHRVLHLPLGQSVIAVAEIT